MHTGEKYFSLIFENISCSLIKLNRNYFEKMTVGKCEEKRKKLASLRIPH